MKNKDKIKHVDCILIFMLDEERDYFLNFNKQFILSDTNQGNFQEFCFFDKEGHLRKGVIATNGTKMGNTEACALFYKLSRKYKADLYINLGVSAVYADVNIGDVIIANTLSTFSEENATNVCWQKRDLPYDMNLKLEEYLQNIRKVLPEFSAESKKPIKEMINKLNSKIKDSELDKNHYFEENIIKLGKCVTVPEVIKGAEGRNRFPEVRKLNVIDMEAYYLVLWHSLIKERESKNSIRNSNMLVFKSPSDYGDLDKNIYEECGSRALAMSNLCTVVSNFCTNVYKFPRRTPDNLLNYFYQEIKGGSTDNYVKISHSNFSNIIENFEKLCSFFIETSNEDFDKTSCINNAFKLLTSDKNRIIFLNGRSGTAKSTFMSYLYSLVLNAQQKAILIDFSKFSAFTNPSTSQIIYLLEKLLLNEQDLFIFLDGIDVNASYYNTLTLILTNSKYSHVSYCIGNLIGNDEPVYLDPNRSDIINLSFSGISSYSDNFEKMLYAAENYFSLLNFDFNLDIVKNFITKAKITNVDFRLLSMMANKCEDLNKFRNLYTFLNNYVTNKFSRNIILKYRESPHIFSVGLSEKIPVDLIKFSNNSYATALAVSQEIIEIFLKKDVEKINNFLQSKFVLSDDMNLFLNHQLHQKQKENILVNVLDILEESQTFTPSICVETQLIYNISSIINNDSNIYNRLKSFILKKVEFLENGDINQLDPLLIIQYRTLCIVLNKYFQLSDPLNRYNELLLKNRTFTNINLSFHFLYYSKSAFTFDDVINLNIESINNEAFLNTYYVLKRYLNFKNIHNDLIQSEQFIYMNIITFLHLIQKTPITKIISLGFRDDVLQLCQKIIDYFLGIEQHKLSKPQYFAEIQDLICDIKRKFNL